MGTLAGAEIDGWLRNGDMVVSASERAARAFQGAFHRRRRADGLAAWSAPNILDWKSFARAAWEERSLDGRLLLNPTQEQALWADILRDEQHLPTTVPASLHRLAGMAMEAHELLCSYSPRHLRDAARVGWDQDAGAFSHWLSAFDDACQKGHLLSPSRVPLGLISLLQSDATRRPPLCAAGFDRMLPVQQALFDAWGEWQQTTHEEPAQAMRFHSATDSHAELEACAFWCNREAAVNPDTRLLVITQDISTRRGEMERAFLHFGNAGSTPLFEFSLGIPLSQVAMARGAHLLLRWIDGALEENELDWLFSSGLAASAEESADLQAYVRALRHRSLQRTEWTLQSFTTPANVSARLPASWVRCMGEARRRFLEWDNRVLSPLEWADKVSQVLESMGWPGERAQSSAEFQAMRRWQQALDTAGSLGFDGRRIGWRDFLSALARTLDETVYAPQSLDAPIQIAGPAESAGLTADAIWFLGAEENAWPAVGSMHPLLPPGVQREAGMPHTTPLRDWEVSSAITARLTASAPAIHFSFARQREGTETRPSRLISLVAGPPQPLPAELTPPPVEPPITIDFADASRVPFKSESVQGGSSVLTAQSQCPFKAFATARLGAEDWEPAEAGLTAAQRGQLLHAVLHAVWEGPPAGLRNLSDLLALQDRRRFVQRHVNKVLREEVPAAIRERMPARYLELEETRLVRVVDEWLQYEATRLPFTVAETEAKRTIDVAGLTLDLRLDRIDVLSDESLLVIDYKTGDVSPKAWELPRPDDVQLPLYAGFALDRMHEQLGGLVFAKVRAGEHTFVGHVGDARTTLLGGLASNRALVKDALNAEQLIDWRQYIEQLARDFLAGRAEVDPRDYPTTCERCGLQAVCRINEREIREDLEADDDAEAADE